MMSAPSPTAAMIYDALTFTLDLQQSPCSCDRLTVEWAGGCAPYTVSALWWYTQTSPQGSTSSTWSKLSERTWDSSLEWNVAAPPNSSLVFELQDAAGVTIRSARPLRIRSNGMGTIKDSWCRDEPGANSDSAPPGPSISSSIPPDSAANSSTSLSSTASRAPASSTSHWNSTVAVLPTGIDGSKHKLAYNASDPENGPPTSTITAPLDPTASYDADNGMWVTKTATFTVTDNDGSIRVKEYITTCSGASGSGASAGPEGTPTTEPSSTSSDDATQGSETTEGINANDLSEIVSQDIAAAHHAKEVEAALASLLAVSILSTLVLLFLFLRLKRRYKRMSQQLAIQSAASGVTSSSGSPGVSGEKGMSEKPRHGGGPVVRQRRGQRDGAEAGRGHTDHLLDSRSEHDLAFALITPTGEWQQSRNPFDDDAANPHASAAGAGGLLGADQRRRRVQGDELDRARLSATSLVSDAPSGGARSSAGNSAVSTEFYHKHQTRTVPLRFSLEGSGTGCSHGHGTAPSTFRSKWGRPHASGGTLGVPTTNEAARPAVMRQDTRADPAVDPYATDTDSIETVLVPITRASTGEEGSSTRTGSSDGRRNSSSTASSSDRRAWAREQRSYPFGYDGGEAETMTDDARSFSDTSFRDPMGGGAPRHGSETMTERSISRDSDGYADSEGRGSSTGGDSTFSQWGRRLLGGGRRG